MEFENVGLCLPLVVVYKIHCGIQHCTQLPPFYLTWGERNRLNITYNALIFTRIVSSTTFPGYGVFSPPLRPLFFFHKITFSVTNGRQTKIVREFKKGCSVTISSMSVQYCSIHARCGASIGIVKQCDCLYGHKKALNCICSI